MKKIHIAGIAFIGLGVFSLFTESDEDKAEKARFSSVDAYELAAEAGFDTKTEYDAFLEQQELEKQAKERGFETVETMQDAEAKGFITAEKQAEAAGAGFDTQTEYAAFLEQERLVRTAERSGFESVVAMQDANARGFFTAVAEKAAADVGATTKDEYDAYQKEKMFEPLLTAKYYGFINTQMTKDFDYDKYAGKSCTSIVNALLATPSKSGDFLVMGTFASLRDGEVISAGLEVKPKTDCERFFGFSCKDWEVTSSDFDITTVDGVLRATENTDQLVSYNYESMETGYVGFEILYSAAFKQKMKLPSLSQSGTNLLCIEP